MHLLCHCEFCQIEFQPRPQVKNARACASPTCQQRRQRANEKTWRQKNTHLSSKEYHRVRRQQRLQKIRDIAQSIFKCLEVGARFLNQASAGEAKLYQFFVDFISSLGLRQINKFWPVQLI